MPRSMIRLLGTKVRTHHPALAFPDRETAHERLAGTETDDLPPGTYTVRAIHRNKASWHDPDLGDGYYYLLVGEGGRVYVWQDELERATLEDPPEP